MKKYGWHRMYTIILVANVIYIVSFFIITKLF